MTTPRPRTRTVIAHHNEPRAYGDLTITDAVSTAREELRQLGMHLRSYDPASAIRDTSWETTRDVYLASIDARLSVAGAKMREITGTAGAPRW